MMAEEHRVGEGGDPPSRPGSVADSTTGPRPKADGEEQAPGADGKGSRHGFRPTLLTLLALAVLAALSLLLGPEYWRF